MFMTLLEDPYIDTFKLDLNYLKPRVSTVIFSAFHKILYQREKINMRRKFQMDLGKEYIDFNSIMIQNNQPDSVSSGNPQQVSVSNKTRKDLDLSNKMERYFLKNQLIA